LPVHAGETKADRPAVRDFGKKIDASVKVSYRPLERSFLQQGARVSRGVRLQRDSLLEEPLHVGVFGVRPVAGNAHRASAIDFLKPGNDRAQVTAKALTVSGHVIYGQNGNGQDVLFPDPLWSDQFGGFPTKLPRVVWLIEMNDSISILRIGGINRQPYA
jgi:hypothetical protein